MSQIKEVAVAIIFNPLGEFLLGQRPSGKPYAGYWEFPGGKLEAGETVWQALCRELDEELGVQAQAGTPWVTRVFAYPHATVRLHFWRVTAWQGEPHGREGQALAWGKIDSRVCDPLATLPQPLLPASLPVLRWLALPDYVVLSNAATMGLEHFLQASLQVAQAERLPWLLVREPTLSDAQIGMLYTELGAICRQYRVRLSLSSRHQLLIPECRQIHFTAHAGAHLLEDHKGRSDNLVAEQGALDSADWLGVSCHTQAELQALDRGVADYAFLGQVQATPSHPEQAALGWARWAELVQGTPVPTYAIGGLTLADIPTAQAAGGQGVALQRHFWQAYA